MLFRSGRALASKLLAFQFEVEVTIIVIEWVLPLRLTRAVIVVIGPVAFTLEFLPVFGELSGHCINGDPEQVLILVCIDS